MTRSMILSAVILLTSLTSNANQLDILKSTTATKYDIAKVELDVLSYALTKELTDQNVKGTDFKYSGFEVYEDNQNLGITIKYSSRSKNITNESCELLVDISSMLLTPQILAKQMWPTMTKLQLNDLTNNIKIKTQLEVSDNKEISKKCN